MKFEPVEGNGWYAFGKRIPPPPAFFVKKADEDSDGNIAGVVSDRTSDFDGYHLRASPTFFGTETWLTIHLSPTNSDSDGEEREVFGYVKVAT